MQSGAAAPWDSGAAQLGEDEIKETNRGRAVLGRAVHRKRWGQVNNQVMWVPALSGTAARASATAVHRQGIVVQEAGRGSLCLCSG